MKKVKIDKVIEVQTKCLTAIKAASNKLEMIYDDLKDQGIIEDYQLFISPYNNGYEAKIECDVDFRNDALEPYYELAVHSGTIFIYPDSFFNDYYNEGNGDARITFKTMKYFVKEKGVVLNERFSDSEYATRSVITDEHISKVCREFVETFKW